MAKAYTSVAYITGSFAVHVAVVCISLWKVSEEVSGTWFLAPYYIQCIALLLSMKKPCRIGP